jgi:molecular chaperone GrpE
LSLGADLIAEALAAVEAREAEARSRDTEPTESDEDDDQAADFIEFVFHEDDGDESEETDEDGSASIHMELTGGADAELDGDVELDLEQAAADAELARARNALDDTRAALKAAEVTRDEALAAAAEQDEARRRARRSARKYRTALEREVQLRKRVSSTQELLRGRLARAESLLEDAEAGRMSAIETIAQREADLQRANRDIQRLRRREESANEEGRRKAYERVCKEILPVLDNLRMAVDAGGTEADRVLAGVRMVLGQFTGALDRVGLSRVDSSPGTAFDPNLHEAMQMVPSDHIPAGHIVAELSTGFRFDRRLLRAARVTVASPPPASSIDPADEAAVPEHFSSSSDHPESALSDTGEE